jgi:hypothetical protein
MEPTRTIRSECRTRADGGATRGSIGILPVGRGGSQEYRFDHTERVGAYAHQPLARRGNPRSHRTLRLRDGSLGDSFPGTSC